MTELHEIKKGQTGNGLLIDNDGYMQLSEERILKEGINAEGGWHVPHPFVVDAVFQKFGIKNANGRIYPEDVLKREVERYQQLIAEHRALGECYTPDVLILTEEGWKMLGDVKEGENILTLNTTTGDIEVKPIQRKIEKDFDGDMVRIKGRNINDLVTPEHGFPIYNREHKFDSFKTAKELLESDNLSHYYIPKQGNWVGRNDEFFIIPNLPQERVEKMKSDIKEKYSSDLVIPMKSFAQFMGIYLSEGTCDKKEGGTKVTVSQNEGEKANKIREIFENFGLDFTETISDGEFEKRKISFHICDMRLCKYLQQFGICYDKYVPQEIKQQNKEVLRLFYDAYVLGDGRIRGDKRKNYNISDDVFSTSKRLLLDLNEIQLKIGYSGTYSVDERDRDRYFCDRLIEAKNSHPMHFSFKSLSKGIYLDKRFLKIEKEQYNGKVMCVEVENHTWYVMSHGKCHWTKNCNHPETSSLDLSRISHNIIELHWEGRTLVGKLELNTTEGFRQQGIVTSCGDEVANLLMNGFKIGVSSRAVGSVEEKLGVLYVGQDMELLCWDIVATPSTPNAYISISGQKGLSQYIESDESKSDKSAINEKINKIRNILK